MPPHIPRPESIDDAHEKLEEFAADNHSLRNHVGAARMTLELTGRRLLALRGRTPDPAIDEMLTTVQRTLVRLGGRPLDGVPIESASTAYQIAKAG